MEALDISVRKRASILDAASLDRFAAPSVRAGRLCERGADAQFVLNNLKRRRGDYEMNSRHARYRRP